jgi:hypothetical protein
MTSLSKSALIALTVCVSSPASSQWYQGPSGGTHGTSFDTWQVSQHGTDINSIGVNATGDIRCITIGYRSPPINPGRITLNSYGKCRIGDGQPGYGSRSLDLQLNEYILGVAGTYDDHINSLKFYTNLGRSASWGSAAGRTFGYTAPSGQMIVAFMGRAGTTGNIYVDAIGVMYAPCSSTKLCK